MFGPAWGQELHSSEGGGDRTTEQCPREAAPGPGPPQQWSGLCLVLCHRTAAGLQGPGLQGVQAADITGLYS